MVVGAHHMGIQLKVSNFEFLIGRMLPVHQSDALDQVEFISFTDRSLLQISQVKTFAKKRK